MLGTKDCQIQRNNRPYSFVMPKDSLIWSIRTCDVANLKTRKEEYPLPSPPSLLLRFPLVSQMIPSKRARVQHVPRSVAVGRLPRNAASLARCISSAAYPNCNGIIVRVRASGEYVTMCCMGWREGEREGGREGMQRI